MKQLGYFGFFLIGFLVNGFSQQSPLFQLLSPEKTGVYFSNPVKDTIGANILIYESFYDGGGVGIGDVNNDGLLDLYLSGNQVNDQLYLNKGNLQFKNITQQAGINNNGSWSTGVSFVDINQDGLLDIYVCKSLYDDSPLLRVNHLYINNGINENGIPTFTENAKALGLNDFWRSMQATFLDYDRDGDPDMFLVNQPPNPGMFSPLAGHNWLDTTFSCRLLENQGGKFIDVSRKAGIKKRGYGLNAITADFNNDRWIDIYVSNDYDSPDFLYINQKDSTFKNVINQSMKHISYFSMGSDAADINNDGWLDLFVLDMVAEDNYRLKANMGGMEPEKFWNIVNAGGHHQYMFNSLQLNRGTDQNGRVLFSDIAQFSGVASTDWSWAPLIADFDNDGLKDIFVTNGIKKDLRNTDAIKKTENYLQKTIDEFTKSNPNAGEVNIWDVINLEDILGLIPSEKLSNYIYRNTGDYKFEKKMQEWGLNQESHSSGAAYGDLDNDGDLDLVVNNLDEIAFIYENKQDKYNSNNYLRVNLTDQTQHTCLIGSRIEIHYKGGKQFAEISESRGFFSDSEDLIHFGLEKHKKVDKVLVYWSTGEISELTNVKANQVITIDKNSDFIDHSPEKAKSRFSDRTSQFNLPFVHRENDFDDFQRETLLPHKMSTLGPGLAVGDVNLDGKDDFFVGGAIGQAGELFIQNEGGQFKVFENGPWKDDLEKEDIDAHFIDIDNDGDLDLYVVSGGNEKSIGSAEYQDRLYLNNRGHGFSKSAGILPQITESGSKVIPGDFDNDGDIDLFIGGRQTPGQYPKPADSYLLQNTLIESGKPGFKDATTNLAPELLSLGMVTDAKWEDFDLDGDLDLIIVGEWMPITILENQDHQKFKINNQIEFISNNESIIPTGWWNSITIADLDGDGDNDYVVGNLGLNYKYKASEEEPFSIHYDDFDNNGAYDIVLSYYNFGDRFPVRGRSCSSQQIPDLKKSFPDYHSFASATLSEIYGEIPLAKALHYEVNTFANLVIERVSSNQFVLHPLPPEAQFSSINSSLINDLDKDGKPDLIIAGNLYNAEVETPRSDAGLGLMLSNLGDFKFESVPAIESGLQLPYEVKNLQFINIAGQPAMIAGTNNDRVRIIFIND